MSVNGSIICKKLKLYLFHFSLTVTDAMGNSDSTSHVMEVLKDIPVPPWPPIIDPDIPDPQPSPSYTVTFKNTDGTETTITIPAGGYIDKNSVPEIVDVDGLYEHGWTTDGLGIVDPFTIPIKGNLTFVVYMTTEGNDPNTHLLVRLVRQV